ncbi:MAG: tRNA uridine-5-carboxymethylaminomethyl(34) synthesis GTPase MnmE [Anaerovoracaceae bacterium]|nr:tRNA uridine-5-carboxymethylaminomethyl(34) synthesis GTPase MnmE [Bacillota bacterium]MEE0516269.1 tRNA uridine-5-carboxymethylaminomethyl(34) synthesis GTPase MnmE [Anaerovoracaceae bacterium]
MREDTIAAIATAPGEGGIGIVRISGEKAFEILKKIFIPASSEIKNRMLTYGHIADPDSGSTIDEVMAVYMKGPRSYTAEDVAEIQCHGSMISLKKILELTFRNGARPAEKGEFTKRAFLNGRLDLSQAEAVIDLIRAKSDKTFDVALSQLEGLFSEKIKDIRADLVDILVLITVNIDYPDEDIEEMTYEKLIRSLTDVREKIRSLLATSDTGRIIREGLSVSIVGKPNVGKSSLLNALTGQNRAIVTDIPGTTRDIIEENIVIKNIPVVLTDTAGIRNTEDLIEKIGIEKSKEAFNRADLIIFVIDSSADLEEEDYNIMEYIGERKSIVLFNKTDKGIKVRKELIKEKLPQADIIDTALIDGRGIEDLASKIENLVYGGHVKHGENLMVTNVRHKNLLAESETSLNDAIQMTSSGEPLEFIEIDVNRCYEATGEIIGETADSDIIDKVFERFCLGK